jgi:hypothetical protein
MTSERRIKANRRNAQNSTGPRTPAGKARVALNGMKHGLLSREALVPGEREADLVAFGKRLRGQLAPLGELEILLTDRVVSCGWRLRRLIQVESRLFGEDGEKRLENAFSAYGREKMSVLSRYEATLERSLYRALHELQRLQAAREGKTVLPPEVVDAEISFAHQDSHVALLGKDRRVSVVEHQSHGGTVETLTIART